MVAGLVAITPAANSVSPIGAIILGLVAGVLCALAVGLKYKLNYDDSLDVVGVHLVGGLWGTLAIGFLATEAAPAGVNGLFYGGGVDQLWRQAVGAFAVLIFSFVLTLGIGFLLQKTIGFRLNEDDEMRRHRRAPSTPRPATISPPSARSGAESPSAARPSPTAMRTTIMIRR